MSSKSLKRLRILCALALLLAGAALLAPPGAQAVLHYVNEGNACYGCHTLDPLDEEPGTNLIASVSRTLALMKLYNGGTVPARFGCTYCHYNPANATMKEALSHFGGKTSKHPVGVNFVTGVETNNEYLSTVGSATANETDCVDCHDVALLAPGLPTSYVGHAPAGVGVRAAGQNPYMLRSVAANGQYDNLCRVCHGTAAVNFKGQNVKVTSHADASAAQIREDDQTNLRTTAAGGNAQCTACHDTHFSGKVKLFNDGHEGDTAIVSADCTTVCHYAGDVNNSFESRGHGKALSTYKYKSGNVDFTAGNYIGINLSCTSCHATLDTSDTSTTRKAHVESPTAGTPQDNYKAKFNLNLPVQAFDDGSSFGNPQAGVCYSCHSSYDTHRGVAANTEAGCQDCHDEHAENTGTVPNYFMIPETSKTQGTYTATPPGGLRAKPGTELVSYPTPQRNPTTGALNQPNESFYNVGNANGVCDNAECHGAKYTPLSAYMAGTGHSGGGSGTMTPGMDCAGCHPHNGDPQGAWRASGSCNDCHSYPGLPTTGAEHILSGVHNRHVEAPPTGYGIGCTQCHYLNAHNSSGFIDGGVWSDATVPPTNVNIRFDTSAGTVDAGATNLSYNGGDADVGTTASATHNGTCAGLYCHGNNTTRQADWTGSNETPAWSTTDPAQLGCGECHANPPATPAANNAHADHMAVSTYVCGDCHGVVAETTHVDNQVTMSAALSYTGGLSVGDGSYGTCSTGSCHNATAAPTGNVAWNVAATNCNQCHYRTAAGVEDNFAGNDKSASMVVAAEWTGYGHGKAAGPVINLACTACHAMANGHDFTATLNGAANNPYRLSTGFTCSNTTGACHTAGKSGPVTGVDISTVQDHDKALMGVDGKRTWPWTPECANCHDPHGDATNIAMIGNEIYESAALNLLAAPVGLVVQNTAMTFTNTTAGHDAAGYTYADSNAPFSSICQECHSATGTGMLSYLDGTNTSAGSHPAATGGNPGDCSSCHKHATAFKPSGCGGCHGNGGTSYWPDSAGSNRTLYPDRLGRHLVHMTEIGTRMGYGAAPAAYTGTQQVAICAFCHNDPSGQGGGGHYAGSYNKTDAPADVGSFNQMWGAYAADGGTAATYTPAVYTTDVFTSGTACANLDCHNNKTSPAGYEWYGATATACIMCHDDITTGGVPTGVTHLAHTGASATYGITTITCASCHSSAPAIVWGTPGTQPSSGHIDGTFVAAGSVAFTYNGNYPTAFGSCGANACHNDGNGASFAPASTYTWGTAISGCGFCHLAAPTAANHTDHLSSAFGPLFGTNCAGCHVSNTNNTTMAGKPKHINGLIEFANVNTATSADAVLGLTAPGAAPDATSTDRCNHCHSTASVNGSVGAVLAKTNWNTGAYTLPCLSCHNGTDAATTYADGTGRAAPNMLGDDTTYGAEVKGHNLATGSYTDPDLVATNVAANKACSACHDVAIAHLNNADDTSYTGNRLLTTINTVATASTVTGACNACHATAAGSPASSQVSAHGNANASFTNLSTHDGNAEQFVYRCEACHEVHGMVNGTGYVNIYMIKPAIGVGGSFTTVPGGAGATTATIRFVRVSGTDSYDDGLTPADNVCVACHTDAGRPGSGTGMLNTGGNHGANNDYTNNEQGNVCIGCHTHNYDNNVATADGFMPLQCNSCHTYPGLSGTAPANQHRLSAVHDKHVGRPSTDGTISNKGFACSVCHAGAEHNNAGALSGLDWGTVTAANIQVRFDPNWNPATTLPADGGVGDSPDYVGTTCNNLYCHGATLGAGGTATAPAWSGTFASCTVCHLDTTALNSRSHGPHLTTTTGAGAVCADCHTAYDLSPAGTHMNGSVSFVAALTYSGNAADRLPLAGLGSCGTNRCHNNGQLSGPILAYTWGTAINGTNSCTECHNATTATLATNSHGPHLTTTTGAGAQCVDCHGAGASTAPTHANGTVNFNVSGGAVTFTYGVAADAVVALNGGTFGSCGTNRCHNNGQSAPTVSTYTWGTAINGTNSCTECHNATTGTLVTLRHADHLAMPTYVCSDCHDAAAATTNTHADGTVNLKAGLTYSGAPGTLTVATANTFGSCSTGSCHNATAGTNVAWNTTASNCDQCHLVTTAATEDNWNGQNKVMSAVVAAEWTGYGHGKTAGPAINLACTACHSIAVAHDTTTNLSGAASNPYRLSAGFTCSNTGLGCHVAGRTGPVTGVDISTVQDHDKALMGADGKRTWPWTPQCANCHDPHGDATNIAMIGNEIYESAALNLLAAPVGLVAENTAMTFTNTTAGHDAAGYAYADSTAPFSSICQECHTAAGTGMLSYLDNTNTSAGSHPAATGGNPGDCSSCHKHATAFKPTGCAGCHGNGGTSYWPDTVGSNRTLYPDRVGRHLVHMTEIGTRMGYGAAPAAYTGAQQVAICAFCHNDPSGQGGGGHYAGSYNKTDAPADVGSFNQMWGAYAADGGTAATYTPAVYTTDVFTSGTACANLDCHNNKTSPAGYEWYGATATACIMCHDDVTAAVTTTGVTHVAHTGASATYGITTITCASCHSSAPAIAWGTPGTQPSSGHIDGTFVAAGAVAFTYNGNYPTAFGSCGANACHNDGNGATFAPASTYTWGTAISGCGFCHLAAPAAANHTDHLSSAFGPLFGTNCAGCHVSNTNNTTMAGKPKHINGLIEFANVNTATSADAVLGLTAPALAPDATSTDRCNHCHSTASVNGSVGTVLVKTNWNTGAYTLPCLSCHNGTDPATTYADGTGRAAPNMLGDDSTYGAEVKGHNLATGSYTDADSNATNVAANKACNACHDVAIAHLNNADDTSYTGNRLLTTINTVATASTVTGACNACHATGAGVPASSQVSTHGNVNASFTALSTHDGNAEQFGYRCEACHEVHGMVNGAGYVNIYMIKPAVGVGASFTSTPGGAGATTATIRFVRMTGTDSYDDGLTPADNVCVACHADAGRPGGGTGMTNTGGNHAANNDYTNNEQGRSCIGCHSHNYDASTATADGFMPLQCNGCHTYPGLSGTAPANQHQLSAVHDEHVGRPSTLGTISNKGFACSVCHYGSQHNNAGIATGLNWATVTAAHIQVRFDPSWNPATTTANDGGATDSTDYVGTTCNNLYCHGATLGAGGTATAPAWSGTLTGCTYCHLDTTALNSRSHGPHLTTTTGAGAVCADCHTAYDLSAAGNHMNGSVTFVAALTYSGNAADRLPLVGLGSCGTNRCHNNGQSSAPILAYTWGTALNGTNSCTECHNATTGTLVTNSHGPHLTTTTGAGVQCFECHGTGAATAATHANGTVNFNVSGGAVTFTYGVAADAVVALNGGTFGSCGTNRCHNNGQSAAPVSTYTWGTAINGTGSCNDCHNATTGTLVTNSHGPHLTTTTGAGAQCVDCHGVGASTAPTHGDGTVNFNVSGGAVTFTYGVAADRVVALTGGTFGSCGTNRCHNNGQSAPAILGYTWGTAINGTNSCTECHNATTGTLVTLRHADHLAMPTYGCGDCHDAAAATVNTHADGTVNLKAGLTYSGAPGTLTVAAANTFGNCSTGSCHNGTASPTGNVVWNSTASNCDQCHLVTTAATEDNWNGQNKVMSAVVATEWTGVGHGRGGIALACTACHSIAVAHDTTTNLTGATSNPYRLSAAFTCSNATAACHTAGKSGPVTGVDISTIKDHDKANMSNGKRTWPWTPQCANCHDPHGDAANIAMIGNELYDSAALNLLGAPGGGINAENVALVFTNATVGQDASGASYANSGAPYSSVCQECHTAAGTGMLSYLDNTNTSAGSHPSATGGNPGDCSNCHKHAEGFNPSGCVSCHDGSVALAPNVIDGTLPSNPALSYNWFGTDGAKQDGGHGDPQGRDGGPAPECGDCHDILVPAGTHGDGIVQSVYNNATRNANTAHLKAEYFVRSSPPSVPVGAGTWSTQVYFDNYCAEKCHPGKSVPVMRHEIDTLVTDTNHWSVELGTHMTLSDGDALGANYPIDADLNTAANAADVDYVPCVGCHDPHGTTVVEPSKSSNRMVRDNWMVAPTLCNVCHN